MLTLLALLLGIEVSLDLHPALRRAPRPRPAATCAIRVVAIRFHGEPGQRFVYAGETFEVPRDRSIELIAERRATTYRIGGRTLPIDTSAVDGFSIAQVVLPKSE